MDGFDLLCMYVGIYVSIKFFSPKNVGRTEEERERWNLLGVNSKNKIIFDLFYTLL